MESCPRVLIVDDHQVIATTLAVILNGCGFDAIASFDGPHALGLARGSHFDVLITDIGMRPLNGIQTAEAFHAISPSSEIMLLSGTVSSENILAQTANRGFDFKLLSKPIHPLEIIDALRALRCVTSREDAH